MAPEATMRDNPHMSTSDPDRLREMIVAALRAAGTDATNLARDIGRGKDFVRDFLSGKKGSMSAPALSNKPSLASAAHRVWRPALMPPSMPNARPSS